MGNTKNRKKKNSTWRKSRGQHVSQAMKRRRMQGIDDNDVSEKENIPVNTIQLLAKDTEMNSTGRNTLQNVNLMEMSLNDNVCADPGEKTFHELQNVELMEMPLNDNVCADPGEKTFHVLQNVELMEIPIQEIVMGHNSNTDRTNALKDMELSQLEDTSINPSMNTCSDHVSLEKLPDNTLKMNTPCENQNESADDIEWYEVSSAVETEKKFSVEGRRIIDFAYVYKRLQEISDHSPAFGCTLKNVQIISEKRNGLLSKYTLVCNMCNLKFYLDSEPQEILNLNKSAVSAVISTGIGYSQFTEICAALDCPSLSETNYSKVQNEVYDDWRSTAVKVMEEAAERERNAAIAEGRVKNGYACIDVIADGVWSKRSFNTNFSALSGAAAIIGKKFGEVLFIGIKNKYCCICARAQNKGVSPADHVCYKNYSGSSSGMESDILLEGFKQSIPMYNIIYERMVADGDSSTYKKILDGRPYSDCTVEKVECKNHIFRNMCKKLKNITTETKYPTFFRKKITTQRILAIRKVITSSITEHFNKDIPFTSKVNSLYKDITNAYNHAFGNHEHCQPYYCLSQRNSEDLTLILKTSSIWDRIKFIVNTVAAKARSLMHNSDSNRVESFNNIIAKFVGGKRINFSLRQGYEARCNAAVVSFNTKRPLCTLHKSVSGESPRRLVKKLEQKRIYRHKSKSSTKRRKLFSSTIEGDKNYGENCQRPDMADLELTQCKEDFLKNLQRSEEDRDRIQKSTILQRDSSEWLELRRKLLTASHFSKVVNRRQYTSVKNLLKSIIYPKNLSHVPSLKHGTEHESIATDQLASQLKIKIKPCGLFIDKEYPFLGATPDGVVEEDTIIEIKCPITAFQTSLDEAIEKKKVKFWKKSGDEFIINKKHPWYIQVQGQLHITGRQKCIFGVWSGCDKQVKVEIIQRDDEYWKQCLEEKLIYFYKTFMLPELCDPRHVRNMSIRDLDECQ